MAFPRRRSRLKPGWAVIAAGTDLFFLLLVFFLISSRFVAQPGLAVALPYSTLQVGPRPEAEIITIAAGAPPSIYLKDSRIALEDLREQLGTVTREIPLIVRADAGIPHQVIIEVSSIALAEGFSVILATAPSKSASPDRE